MARESRAPQLEVAARNLLVDCVSRDAIDALRTAGIELILLKGPTTGGWLYKDGAPRPYVDCDILVSPANVARSRVALRGAGFACVVGQVPGSPPMHAECWQRALGSPPVDLHHTLFGLEAPADAVWAELRATSRHSAIARREVRTLSEPAHAMHLALHAVQSGVGQPKPIEDLRRAVNQIPLETWRGAACLAERLDGMEAFAFGLRLVPEGAAIAATLRLPEARPLDLVIRSHTPPRFTVGFARLRDERSLIRRVGVVLRKLFPPPVFLRNHFGIARRGPLGVVAAYLWWPLWLAWHLPKGFRTYRRILKAER